MDEICKSVDQLEKEMKEIKNVLNGLYKRLQGKFQCDISYSGSKVQEIVLQTIMDLTYQLSENSKKLVRDQFTSVKGIAPTNVIYLIPRTMPLYTPSEPDMMQSQQVLNISMGTSQGPPPSPDMDDGDQFRPPPGISKLYDLSGDPERKVFLDKLIMYEEERGKPLIHCPTIPNNHRIQPLDLYKLYVAVKERGGFVEVMRRDMWKDIAGSLGISVTSFKLRVMRYCYVSHLLRFECKYDRGGIDLERLISSLQSKLKKTKAESADTEMSTLESSAFQCSCPACEVVYKKCHNLITGMLEEERFLDKARKAAQEKEFQEEQLRLESEQSNAKFKELLLKFDSSPMFQQETKEEPTSVMDTEKCDLFASTEKLSMEKVFDLYASANKHDVHDQKEACRRFIKNHLSVGTFWETFRQCLQYPELNFIDLFLEFFHKNSEKLIEGDEFKTVGREYPVEHRVLVYKFATDSKHTSKN